ncbi:hypothetical protein ACQP1U_06325 [Actinomycetota bacterium]
MPTYDEMLRMAYRAAYDYLTEHPEFDGRPRPGLDAIVRRGVDPQTIQPWPGVADVRTMTRDEWVAARFEAVARGDEEPPLRRPGGGA